MKWIGLAYKEKKCLQVFISFRSVEVQDIKWKRTHNDMCNESNSIQKCSLMLRNWFKLLQFLLTHIFCYQCDVFSE
ncbi:hypothetical protein Bhyg_11888 [Pseudolycoriella hygida]|uniref:Uncharacterized protein n=1 Tax=Pseudolycoriella hygida TaxID=35572 RepID=A0A9Q0S0N7_9DIPT|nr:hypothetical protein Bhyg_11888 [Pseudolycoriella hygida]